MNKFIHMFQSSWSDFTDFERIFVRIKNTISGQLYLLYCTVLYCIVLYYILLYYSRVCDATLEGGLHVWLPVSEWLQPRHD